MVFFLQKINYRKGVDPPPPRLPCVYRCLNSKIISLKLTQLCWYIVPNYLSDLFLNYGNKIKFYKNKRAIYCLIFLINGCICYFKRLLQAVLRMKCNCIDRGNAAINHPLVLGSTLVLCIWTQRITKLLCLKVTCQLNTN